MLRFHTNVSWWPSEFVSCFLLFHIRVLYFLVTVLRSAARCRWFTERNAAVCSSSEVSSAVHAGYFQQQAGVKGSRLPLTHSEHRTSVSGRKKRSSSNFPCDFFFFSLITQGPVWFFRSRRGRQMSGAGSTPTSPGGIKDERCCCYH